MYVMRCGLSCAGTQHTVKKSGPRASPSASDFILSEAKEVAGIGGIRAREVVLCVMHKICAIQSRLEKECQANVRTTVTEVMFQEMRIRMWWCRVLEVCIYYSSLTSHCC